MSKKTDRVDCNLEVPFNNVAFVLSCPGKRELDSGKLCAGKTGENLGKIVAMLHEERSDVFPSGDRYDYIITNASNKVYYKALNNRSEAKNKDICHSENIRKLERELKNAQYVIALGKKAQMAVDLCQLGVKKWRRSIIRDLFT